MLGSHGQATHDLSNTPTLVAMIASRCAYTECPRHLPYPREVVPQTLSALEPHLHRCPGPSAFLLRRKTSQATTRKITASMSLNYIRGCDLEKQVCGGYEGRVRATLVLHYWRCEQSGQPASSSHLSCSRACLEAWTLCSRPLVSGPA